jgi:hypothetical protein
MLTVFHYTKNIVIRNVFKLKIIDGQVTRPMARHLTLLALLLGLSLSAFAQAQQSKLPPCPAVDYSKHKHLGLGGRTEKWNNCYGRYVGELNDANKEEVLEVEFRNGLPYGQGTPTQSNGYKCVG